MSDRFRNLKYMGLCMSQLPPEEVETTFADFVIYAKFHLSVEKHVLMEDPIWDKYTDESILVEYFANLFIKDKDARQKFEAGLVGNDEDFADWADKMIQDNQKELAEKAKALEDSVSLNPEAIGD